MSETQEGYTPDTGEMILAYALYRDTRDMGKYKYDREAGYREWARIQAKATEEAYRWLESVKQEAYDQGKNEMLRWFKGPETIYGSRTS